jgi:hypothetical protein
MTPMYDNGPWPDHPTPADTGDPSASHQQAPSLAAPRPQRARTKSYRRRRHSAKPGEPPRRTITINPDRHYPIRDTRTNAPGTTYSSQMSALTACQVRRQDKWLGGTTFELTATVRPHEEVSPMNAVRKYVLPVCLGHPLAGASAAASPAGPGNRPTARRSRSRA